MKKLVLLCAVLIAVSACGGKPAPAPKAKIDAKAQQAQADAAFKELDCEVAGTCAPAPVTAAPAPTAQPEQKARPYATEAAPAPSTKPEQKARPYATGGSGSREGTKYPIENGLPVWFMNPYLEGYLGGVGVAKPQPRGGYSAQKRVAVTLAQAEISRTINTLVQSELSLERTNVDTQVAKYYKSKMETMSRQKSEEYLKGTVVMDQWLNPKTGELFVWVVLPK